MTIRIDALLLMILLLGFSSCLTSSYLPTPPTAPMLITQGDIAIAGVVSYAPMVSGSLGYAISKKFSALIQSGYDPADAGPADWLSADVALGYATTLDDQWRMEIFAGGGRAKGRAHDRKPSDYCWVCLGDGIPDWTSEIKTIRGLLSVNFGLLRKSHSLILGLNAAYVHVDRFQVRWRDLFGDGHPMAPETNGHAPFITAEGFLLLRVHTKAGFNPFGFASYGFALPDDIAQSGHYQQLSFGLGLQFQTNLCR